MKKKWLALALAATMAIGMSTTAFATDTGKSVSDDGSVSQQFDIDASVQTVRVNVTVTANPTTIANPYGMQTADVSADDTLKVTPLMIKNVGETPIAVTLTGKIDLSGNTGVTVGTTATAPASPTGKQLYAAGRITADKEGTKSLLPATGATPVAAVAYKTTAVQLTTTPVLLERGAVSGDDSLATLSTDDIPAKTTGATPHTKGWSGFSKVLYIQVEGWTCGGGGKVWTTADAFKVITSYDIKPASTTTISTGQTKSGLSRFLLQDPT